MLNDIHIIFSLPILTPPPDWSRAVDFPALIEMLEAYPLLNVKYQA